MKNNFKSKFVAVLCSLPILLVGVSAIAGTCVDPDLTKVSSSETFMLCDGTTATGKLVIPPTCTAEASTGCVVPSTYRGVDTSVVTAAKLKYGSTLAGVTGTKRQVYVCKNGRGIGVSNGTSTTPWNGIRQASGSVTVTSGSATVTGVGTAFDTALSPGDTVIVGSDSRIVSSITNATTMTVTSNFSANAGPGATITYFSPFSDYSVDDNQNGANPWYAVASDRSNCNETNFTDVTSTTSALTPASNLNASWTKIFRDEMTGVLFTNPLAQGAKSWPQAIDICVAINGGSAGSGWRLPTFKELAQLSIDGMAKLGLGFENSANYFWTSTAQSSGAANWAVRVSMLGTAARARNTLDSVVCIK